MSRHMSETSQKAFTYINCTSHIKVTLTDDGFSINGNKVDHLEMRELGNLLFQCEKVLEAHGIYVANLKGGAK